MAERARGFTLLEVLVALAILGLVLVVVLRITVGGAGNVARAEKRLEMMLLAERALTEARLRDIEDGGRLDLALPEGVEVKVERGPLDPLTLDPDFAKAGDGVASFRADPADGETPLGALAGRLDELAAVVLVGGREAARLVTVVPTAEPAVRPTDEP